MQEILFSIKEALDLTYSLLSRLLKLTLAHMQEALFDSVSRSLTDAELKAQDIAAFVLERLLIPGEVSLSALADTLTELGKDVSKDQLESQTTKDIIAFLVEVSRLHLQKMK